MGHFINGPPALPAYLFFYKMTFPFVVSDNSHSFIHSPPHPDCTDPPYTTSTNKKIKQ
jgi:hypothetical protein